MFSSILRALVSLNHSDRNHSFHSQQIFRCELDLPEHRAESRHQPTSLHDNRIVVDVVSDFNLPDESQFNSSVAETLETPSAGITWIASLAKLFGAAHSDVLSVRLLVRLTKI